MRGIRLINGDEPDRNAWQSPSVTTKAPQPVVIAEDVTKHYTSGSATVTALRHINLLVQEGQFVAIRGRSGAGKTTLLNLLAGLDNPSAGRITLCGRELSQLNERARTLLRRTELGFVFQSAHLIPALSARENVEIPLRLMQTSPSERDRRTQEALALVGLVERAHHRAPEMSGGEQQRVAIARALVHAPRLVLADEPTGNLDSHTGQSIVELMLNVAHMAGIAFIVTTHDRQISRLADQVYDISDGVLSLGEP